MAISLSIRFGLSVYTFQGLFLYYLLLYASASDLTDRRVADHLSVSVLALSLISVPTVGIISMLIGGAVSFAIQTGVSVFSGGRYGGADIKISSACVFLLGWSRGLIGLALGLLTGVLFTLIYNKIKKSMIISFLLSRVRLRTFLKTRTILQRVKSMTIFIQHFRSFQAGSFGPHYYWKTC